MNPVVIVMSSTFFASCLLLALAAAQDGLVVTVGEEGAHRKLSSSPGERCADMTFNGLAEGSIISSLSVGNGIEGKPIPGEVEVYGLRKNEKRNKLNNQGKLERYIARRPGRNRVSLLD